MKSGLFTLLTVALITGVCITEACRFNVRDVGFVDLDSSPYRLLVFIDDTVTGDQRTGLEQIPYAALLDTNVKTRVIDVSDVKSDPDLKYLTEGDRKSLPQCLLVSPQGGAWPLALPESGSGFQDQLWDTMEGIYQSPLRDELLDRVLQTYGVALLVEGRDPGQNQRAREAVDKVIDEISNSMEQLPKEISNSPEVLVLKSSDLEKERLLLWSLGLTDQDIGNPAVAVLYGRGRLIGDVLRGEHINYRKLRDVMATIGLSCECGLDRSWMQGVRIPIRWDEEVQKTAAKLLQFDPENPMIKMEMSQILAKGGTGRSGNNGGTTGGSDSLFFGYSEGFLSIEEEAVDPFTSISETSAQDSTVAPSDEITVLNPETEITENNSDLYSKSASEKGIESASEEVEPTMDTDVGWKNAVVFLGGVGLAVLFIGLMVVIRSKSSV